MRKLADKAQYIKSLTDIDFTVFDSSGEVIFGEKRAFLRQNGVFFHDKESGAYCFAVTYRGKSAYVSLPDSYGLPCAKLLATYFADTDRSAGRVQSLIISVLAKTASAADVAELDKWFSGKKYFPVMLITDDVAKRLELTEYLTAISSERDFLLVRGGAIVYLKLAGSEYRFCEELAEVLYEGIKQEQNVSLKVCSGGSASDSVSLCDCIDRCLAAFKAFSDSSDVCHYRDCAESWPVANLPADQRKSYWRFLTDGIESTAFLDDGELMLTAKCFFDNSLSVGATAKQLYVHRNTLTHRLDKIESESGLDIRVYRDAKQFETIVKVHAVLKQNGEI